MHITPGGHVFILYTYNIKIASFINYIKKN